MNKNLAVTLVGVLVAILTIVMNALPDGGTKAVLLEIKNAMEAGPIHDILVYGAGALTAAGFGRMFKTQNTVTGLPPDPSVVAAKNASDAASK